jgi:hypothetical protein
MAETGISWAGVGLRFVFALILVFATYNPEGYSYFHWGILEIQSINALKAFVGVVLLIGWVIFIRATINSLGIVGLVLAIGFFGTLLWIIVDWGWVPLDSIKLLSYIVLTMASAILATGMSWSFVRRKMSGQYDIVDGGDEP